MPLAAHEPGSHYKDLQILVAVGAPPYDDQVDEERGQMPEHEAEHEAPSPLLIQSAAGPAAPAAIVAVDEGR
jgi:hypothetical protein